MFRLVGSFEVQHVTHSMIATEIYPHNIIVSFYTSIFKEPQPFFFFPQPSQHTTLRHQRAFFLPFFSRQEGNFDKEKKTPQNVNLEMCLGVSLLDGSWLVTLS